MRHVKRIGNIFWYGGFGLLILAAVLLSLARLLMPQLQEYHHELERQVSERLGVEVSIGEVDARLVGITPTLILRRLELHEDEQHRASLAEVGVGLDGLRSLLAWRPILKRLSVDGARLTLERNADGSLHLHGIGPFPQSDTAAAAVTDGGGRARATAWIFSQGGLRLYDAQLTWIDRQRDERLEFQRVAMQLRNRGDRHRLRASLQLPESMGQGVNLAMEMHGPLQNPENWSGDIYLKGDGLTPARWLPSLAGVSLKAGELDLELWSRWEQGKPAELEGEISATGLALKGSGGEWSRPAIESRLHGYFGGGGWRLDLAGLVLDREGHSLSRLSVENSADYWRLQADFLPLAPIMELSLLSDAMPTEIRRRLEAMAPHGALSGLRLEHDSQNGPRAQAVAHELGWKAYEKLPGVEGVDGALRVDRDGADLRLNSHKASLTLPRLFRYPLKAETLLGEVSLRRLDDAAGWRLHARDLELANDDIRAELALDLSLPHDATPYLDLRGRFHDGDAASAPHYYPAGVMKEGTLRWLDRAFRSGRVRGGGVLYHGQLKKGAFPFRSQQGRFEVRFDAEGVALDYREEWPALEQVDGEVLFNGPGMSIKGTARIYDSPVEAVEVRIEDLKRPLLQVNASASPSGRDASRMLSESPLARILGRAVASMQLEGKSRLQLELKIPLSRAMAAELPLKVEGVLTLADNRLTVREGVVLEGLSGRLGFSERALKAEELQAQLFAGPVRISGFTESNGSYPRTRIAARGRLDGEHLAEAMPLPFLDTLKGESDWQALIDIEHGGGRNATLRIDSELQGMAVQLPEPLGQSAEESGTPLALDIQLAGERAGLVALSYGERLQGLFETQDGGGLKRAAIHFGAGRAELPEGEAMRLTGSLQQVEPRAWMEALSGLGRGTEGEGSKPFSLPLQVELQRLELSKLEAESAEPQMRSADAEAGPPPMSIHVQRLRYADMGLGELSLSLVPAEGGGMWMNNFLLHHPRFEVSGDGEWAPLADQSSLRLRVKSDDVGAAIEALGFASVISDGRLELNGNLRWPGGPRAIAMDRVAGNVNVFIHEGRIEEVEPGAGKLLGLLSLQALPRRLMLDFSDLFSKGMAFDKISGKLNIEQGNIYSQDLRMESVSADVLVTGRSGLVARDFDQLVMVVPRVSETLPVAAGLALGPQVGAAMLLIQRLIGDDIDQSAMVSYSIKGSWEEPRIEQLAVSLPQAEEEPLE